MNGSTIDDKALPLVRRKTAILKSLVGSGERIGVFMAPFVVLGLTINVLYPSLFWVGGPAGWLRTLSATLLLPGIVIWAWSVFLILTKVPRQELITTGPFALVKHPLYTSVALLVLPWAGFTVNSWLGAALGAVLYIASRMYSPGEEHHLAQTFGEEWERYRKSVRFGWL